MKAESKFRKKVVKFLRTLPFCKIFSIQQKTISGHPDLMLCLDGLFVGIEIKTDEGIASARQILTLEEVLKAKGVALIVRPNNLEAVKELLLKLSKGIRYDSNEIQGLTPPTIANDLRKNRKYADGPSKKLRGKQVAGSDSRGDQEDPRRERTDPSDFREV